MESKYRSLRVGLVGFSLEAYWSQFAGLVQRLLGYLAEVENNVSGSGRTIGVGHIASQLEKFATLLQLRAVGVC